MKRTSLPHALHLVNVVGTTLDRGYLKCQGPSNVFSKGEQGQRAEEWMLTLLLSRRMNPWRKTTSHCENRTGARSYTRQATPWAGGRRPIKTYGTVEYLTRGGTVEGAGGGMRGQWTVLKNSQHGYVFRPSRRWRHEHEHGAFPLPLELLACK